MRLQSYIEGHDLHEAESAISCRTSEWTKKLTEERIMYFLGTAEQLNVNFDTNLNNFYPRFQSRSALGGYFVQLLVFSGHMFSRDRQSSVSWRLKLCCFYGKINQGHVVRPLYGGGPYLRESVMGDSTVIHVFNLHISYLSLFHGNC